MAKVTFTLHNLTDQTIEELRAMDSLAAYAKLSKWAFGDLKHAVKIKFGNDNSFRERVNLNSWLKRGNAFKEYKVEDRRGYKLVTFIY